MFVNRPKRNFPILRSHPLIWVAALYAFILVCINTFRPEWIFSAPQTNIPTDTTSTFVGTIDKVQRISTENISYFVRLHIQDKQSPLVALNIERRNGEQALLPGDNIGFKTKLNAPYSSHYPGAFRYDRWLKTQGVSLTGYCPASAVTNLGVSERMTITQRALRLRASLLQTYASHLPETEIYALVASLTLGDRSMLTPEVRQRFADSGASHILALSGLHLSIIYMVYVVLVLIPARERGFGWQRSIKEALGILLVWLFVLIAGAPVSLIRAACMLTIMSIMQATTATFHAIDRLCIAILLILAINPASLFDVGFQLSCASVAGITTISPLIPRWQADRLYPHSRLYYILQPAGRWMWDIFRTSFCAWVSTCGLTAYYFNYIPLLGAISSVVIIPLTMGIVVLSLAFLVVIPLQSLIGILITWLTQGLDTCTTVIQSLPISGFSWYATAFGVTAFYLLLFILYQVRYFSGRSARRERRPWLTAFVIFALLCSMVEAFLQRPNRLCGKIYAYDMQGTTAIHIIATPDTNIVFAADTTRALRAKDRISKDFWQRYGLTDTSIRNTNCITHNKYWAFRSGILTTAHRCIVFADYALSRRLRNTSLPDQGIEADWLVFCRTCHTDINTLLKYFNPKIIILDAKLSNSRRDNIIAAARDKGVKFHDLRQSEAMLEY